MTAVRASPLAAIIAYCSASILMTVTNKFVLSSYEFHMNFLLLCIQSLSTVLLLELFVVLDLVSHRSFNLGEAKKCKRNIVS
jgi:GDP-mannose transporter